MELTKKLPKTLMCCRLLDEMSAEERKEEARREVAHKRLLGVIGSGGLEEEEAQALALKVVRRARREAGSRGAEEASPGSGEVRKHLGERRSSRPRSS